MVVGKTRELALGGLELRQSANQILLLWGKALLELWRIQHAFALGGIHPAQPPCGLAHRDAAVLRQGLHLAVKVAQLLPLALWQVLEGLHTIQDPLPLLRRQAVEVAQAIQELLLSLGGELLERGIILQSFLLLRGRQVLVLAQPFSAMRAGTL